MSDLQPLYDTVRDALSTIDEYIASLPPEEQALIALYGRWFDEELARWPRGADGRSLTRGQRIRAAKRRARVVTRARGSKRHATVAYHDWTT